jgi:hypothetical protein
VSVEERTKLALDASRTLMLGTQILLGFELQAPFQPRFAELGQAERAVHFGGLLTLLVLLGLLIAPSARHRIVDDGRASTALVRFVDRIFLVSLAPFCVALGLALGAAIGRAEEGLIGAGVGALAGLSALALFYLPSLRAPTREEAPMPQSATPLNSKIKFLLTETRVVLPGVQATLGFQLAIVLSNRFDGLSALAKGVHVAAILLMTVAALLLIAPTAYHRIVCHGESDPGFHRLASRLVLGATVALAAGLAADIYVVTVAIFDAPVAAAATAVVCGLALLSAWQLLPWIAARKRSARGALS